MNRIMQCVPHDLHTVASYVILLVQEYNAKLSDFGLAKDGPVGDKTHVSTRVMGTYGYAAPEYVMTGKHVVRSALPFFLTPLFRSTAVASVHVCKYTSPSPVRHKHRGRPRSLDLPSVRKITSLERLTVRFKSP